MSSHIADEHIEKREEESGAEVANVWASSSSLANVVLLNAIGCNKAWSSKRSTKRVTNQIKVKFSSVESPGRLMLQIPFFRMIQGKAGDLSWTLRRTAMSVALVATLFSTGCVRPPAPMSISAQTSVGANEPMRIAVLPFVLADGVGRSAHALDEAFPAALRSLGQHEVIGVSVEKARLLLPANAIERSTITAADLLRLRDALQVDAVVMGRVDQFKGFDPLAIGATAHLVAVTDGAVLWSATAELDAGRADVQEDVHWWHDHSNGGGNASLAGWRLTLSSPSAFSRYVADRLVETIPQKTSTPAADAAGVGATKPE